MACVPTVPTTIVRPSGGALATKSAPVLPPAPGLLSTITGWFQAPFSFSAIRRARMSGAPPGVKVTTMWIGLAALAGWAIAAGAAAIVAAKRSAEARRAIGEFIADFRKAGRRPADYSTPSHSPAAGFPRAGIIDVEGDTP